MHIWMAMDPESSRVTAQPREFGDGDLPPGPRGRGWPQRSTEIPEEVWQQLLEGQVSPDEQDSLHVAWWNQAGKEGEPPWPSPFR